MEATMWRRNRQQSTDVSQEALVAEAERFLNGHYLDDAFATSREIPGWVWLSTLAHGDAEALLDAESWLASGRPVRSEYDTWGRVLQLLAREIRSMTETTTCTLAEIQRELLVPLELAIIASPVGPATMYRVVTSMLAHVRTQVDTRRI
jgi:hypothetical protein